MQKPQDKSAKWWRKVLKPEYTETVLQLLREGKSEREISVLTKKHRNTVTRYVKHLRQNYHIDFKLLQNELLSELQNRINQMSDRDLIHFLACLLPQKIENTQSGEILHVIELVDPDCKTPNQV